ncbi:MAG: ABC transporter substrate-binding protein [Oligoflexus sp.]
MKKLSLTRLAIFRLPLIGAVCLIGLLLAEMALANTQRLIVAVQGDALTLDPHRASDAASMRMMENMNCGLLRYGEAYGEVASDAASRHQISDDGLVYDFYLHKEAMFHSGRPITATAVKASIERIQAQNIRSNHFAQLQQIEAPSPHHLRLRLKEPFAPLLTYLAHPMNAIVDTQAVDDKQKLDPKLSGCGPFQLERWERDFRLLMRRFAKSFRQEEIRLKAIELRPIADESSRSSALRAGDVHLLLDVPLKDLPKMAGADAIEVQEESGTFWEYLGLQTSKPPFDQRKVRQAIAWAVDRHMLNRLVKFGHAEVLASGPIPSHHWASLDTAIYPRRDINQAKKLLAEAGYPQGFRTTLTVGAQFPYQVDAAIVIKQQLKDIGIDVRIESLESGLFFYKLGQGDFFMTIVGWLGFVDPDEWFFEIFGSQGQWNQQAYRHAAIDDLILQARSSSTRSRRLELYQQIQKQIATDAPMVFLYNNKQFAAYQRQVKGFQLHPTGVSLGLQRSYLQP